MKSKYRFRRILSGVMAAVTILSTVISPLTVYASEEPKAAEPPAYESVKDQLDENEVVKATDLELEVGQDFDVSTDFTNLEIKDESKVKVTFQKAENDAGENFSTSHADTYHAVYYVEPVNQNHPVYQIGRNLIVKEPVTAAQSEPQTEQAVTEEDTGSDDEEAASQEETETVPVETEIVEPETAESETEEAETEEPEETESEFQDGLSESEFDAALEESETENTTDEESGLTLSDVLEQAGEQDIDLMAMEDGETVSFTAVNTSTRATQDVDVTRGAAYYYADYGLGSYVTYKYTVKFGNVSATAYCVQPSKAGPGDGVYKITKLGDSKALAKVCYYGTKASGEMDFSQRNILIFPLENSLSLSIWLRLMPITVVTLFRYECNRTGSGNGTLQLLHEPAGDTGSGHEFLQCKCYRIYQRQQPENRRDHLQGIRTADHHHEAAVRCQTA